MPSAQPGPQLRPPRAGEPTREEAQQQYGAPSARKQLSGEDNQAHQPQHVPGAGQEGHQVQQNSVPGAGQESAHDTRTARMMADALPPSGSLPLRWAPRAEEHRRQGVDGQEPRWGGYQQSWTSLGLQRQGPALRGLPGSPDPITRFEQGPGGRGLKGGPTVDAGLARPGTPHLQAGSVYRVLAAAAAAAASGGSPLSIPGSRARQQQSSNTGVQGERGPAVGDVLGGVGPLADVMIAAREVAAQKDGFSSEGRQAVAAAAAAAAEAMVAAATAMAFTYLPSGNRDATSATTTSSGPVGSLSQGLAGPPAAATRSTSTPAEHCQAPSTLESSLPRAPPVMSVGLACQHEGPWGSAGLHGAQHHSPGQATLGEAARWGARLNSNVGAPGHEAGSPGQSPAWLLGPGGNQSVNNILTVLKHVTKASGAQLPIQWSSVEVLAPQPPEQETLHAVSTEESEAAGEPDITQYIREPPLSPLGPHDNTTLEVLAVQPYLINEDEKPVRTEFRSSLGRHQPPLPLPEMQILKDGGQRDRGGAALTMGHAHRALSQPPAHAEQQQQPHPRYRGVRQRRWGRWVTEIREPVRGQRIWLGSYDSPEEAARVYDMAARLLRGRSARLNFPGEKVAPVALPRSTAEALLRASREAAGRMHSGNNSGGEAQQVEGCSGIDGRALHEAGLQVPEGEGSEQQWSGSDGAGESPKHSAGTPAAP